MSTRHEAVFDLCAGYVLGSLSEVEKQSLEEHLAEGCARCEAELRRLSAGAGVLAASAPELRAPSALRDRVLRAVRAEAGARRRAEAERGSEPGPPLPFRPVARRQPSIATWAWAAAAAVIAIVGIVEWRAAVRLERSLADARERLARLEAQFDNEKRWAELPASPRARVVSLEPTPSGSPALSARVLFDPDSRRAVVTVSNFAAPEGKDYQLWAITKAGPSSLGLVRTDASGHAVIRLPDVGDTTGLAAFAVSLEEKGGAPTPNAPAGPVVMVGKI